MSDGKQKRSRALQRPRPPRRDFVRSEEAAIAQIRLSGRWALGTALGAALLTGVLSLGGQVIDSVNPPAPTSETRTMCTSAYENVGVAVELGIDDADLLENINPEEVDTECGEESEIAPDLED